MHARVCQLAAAGTSWSCSSSLLRLALLCTSLCTAGLSRLAVLGEGALFLRPGSYSSPIAFITADRTSSKPCVAQYLHIATMQREKLQKGMVRTIQQREMKSCAAAANHRSTECGTYSK